MEIEELVKFGMTKTEAEIYIEMCKLGRTQIGPVIKRTGLHRGSVYNAIDDLVKKGFLSFIDKEAARYYNISGKKIFQEVIKEKQEELSMEKKQINELFKDMERLKESNDNQEVEVFYGIRTFKTLFLGIYEECKKNNIEYFFQGRGGEMQDATGPAFYRYTQKLKKKMKIKCRVILDTENVKHSYHKYVFGNIRYLSTKVFSPINIWIYGDTILIVLFKTTPLTTIKIKSKSVSDGFKNYFEFLWKIAKPK